MPRQNSKFKKHYDKKKKGSELPETLYKGYSFSGQKPNPPITSESSSMLGKKAMKDLNYSSYSITVDPYTASLPSSHQYPIVNALNKKIAPFYNGNKNIDGGNMQQYPNSKGSKFLDYYDYASMNLDINYRMLPIGMNHIPNNQGRLGKQLTNEWIHTLAEAVSLLEATTFKNLEFNQLVIKETSLPMGDSVKIPIDEDKPDDTYYVELPEVLYATGITYQTILQNIISIFKKHNSWRSQMQMMLMNAWEREVPELNGLFGLFKKKTFINQLENIALSLPGEYVDIDFASQVAMLYSIPSRKANSITDPIVQLNCTFHTPSLKAYYMNADGTVSSESYIDTTSLTGPKSGKGVYDLTKELNYLFSPITTAAWARGDSTLRSQYPTDQSYFNHVSNLLSDVSSIFTKFKVMFADFRAVLNALVRTGIISWRTGYAPSVIQETSSPIGNYLLVDNVVTSALSSASVVNFNNITKRFRTWTIWDKFYGIPDYDVYAGGSFLAMCFKEFQGIGDDEDGVSGWLPLLVTLPEGSDHFSLTLLNRKGKLVTISSNSYDMKDTALSRLTILPSQSSYKMRVPTIPAGHGLTVSQLAILENTLINTVGSCVVSGTTHFGLNENFLAVYDFEIDDISNSVKSYCKYNCMCRGSYEPGKQDVIGFSASKIEHV